MSIKSWFQKVFVPSDDIVREPFVWTEHMRIVLAIILVIAGAGVMWWILI